MNPQRPLEGRTVVVTRATEQAGTLRTRLEALGAVVIEVPLLRIVEPLDGGAALVAALVDPDRFDWIVVTSPNGAAAVATVLAGRPTAARFAAVGTATADALGSAVDLVPRRQVAEGLLEVFPSGPGRVLLAQGDRARPVLAVGLAERGWAVEAVVAYRNDVAEVDPAVRRAVLGADAIAFASGSAATAFGEVFGSAPTTLRTVSIGPVTTAAAAAAGVRIDVTSDDHSLDGLVRAIATSPAGDDG